MLSERGTLLATTKSVLELIALVSFIGLAGLIGLKFYRETVRPQPVMKAASARGPAPSAPLPKEPVSLKGAALKGSPSAKILVLEFSDYECPYCGKFARDILPELEARYVATGKVRFAFLQFPLTQIHANAESAALASLCAGQQGKFWPMHDRLFQKPPTLTSEGIAGHIKSLQLDAAQFTRCVGSPETAMVLEHHVRTAATLGVNGTPTFFAAIAEADDRARLVARIVSGPTIAGFERVLAPLLEPNKGGTQAGR